MIDCAERSGRGIYEIYRVWSNMKWDAPILNEALDFDRTILTLPVKKVTIKSDGKKDAAKTKTQKELILSHIKENGKITTSDAAEILHVGITRVKALFYELVDSGELEAQGDNKSRCYIRATLQSGDCNVCGSENT